MKFEAGDHVIVRDDLKVGHSYRMDDGSCGDSFVRGMPPYKGQELVIDYIASGKYRLKTIDDATVPCNWTDGMLEDGMAGSRVVYDAFDMSCLLDI